MSLDKFSYCEHLAEDPLLGPLYATQAEQPAEIFHHQFGKSLRQNVEKRALRAERKLKWIVPFTLLVGMALGALGMQLVVNNIKPIPRQAVVAEIAGVIEMMTDQKITPKVGRKDPRLWLTYIAELLHDEKIALVEQELAAFKQTYPDYKSAK